MPNFTLSSPDLKGQITKAQVYDGFGAGGDNISPALHWTDVPAGTKTLLLTCHDTDAPGPGGWWHWVAFNIPVGIDGLPTNASKEGMPQGSVQIKNSYGETGYGGACPPPGDSAHPYVFTLYALKSELSDVDENASPAMVLFVAAEHIIGKASIVAYYAR